MRKVPEAQLFQTLGIIESKTVHSNCFLNSSGFPLQLTVDVIHFLFIEVVRDSPDNEIDEAKLKNDREIKTDLHWEPAAQGC